MRDGRSELPLQTCEHFADRDPLTKAVLERALQGEMTEHLGYAKHDPAGDNSGNSRNGVMRKTLKGDFGEVELERAEAGPVVAGRSRLPITAFLSQNFRRHIRVYIVLLRCLTGVIVNFLAADVGDGAAGGVARGSGVRARLFRRPIGVWRVRVLLIGRVGVLSVLSA